METDRKMTEWSDWLDGRLPPSFYPFRPLLEKVVYL